MTAKKPPYTTPLTAMSEEEFFDMLRGTPESKPLVVLGTTSPDKRDIYRELFLNHGKEEETKKAGLDVYYTDIGALGIPPRKTPEMDGEYDKHLDEKAENIYATLSPADVVASMRRKLEVKPEDRKKHFDPSKAKIIGMAEDSGMELLFKDKATEARFIDAVVTELKPRLRDRDHYLLDKLKKTGFPGPNFKPLQERLDGGFHELMDIIYKAADVIGEKELRFSQTINVSFVSIDDKKFFKMPTFKGQGRLLSRQEFDEKLLSSERGKPVNINFVQVFDGQANGAQDTVEILIDKGLHEQSSKHLPVDYPRRQLTEYIQKRIGKRHASDVERKRTVRVAAVNHDVLTGARDRINFGTFNINDLELADVPTRPQMMADGNIKTMGDADAVVLVPDNSEPKDRHLYPDPNLRLLQHYIVSVETEPEAMRIPLIIDNRSKGFNNALEVLSDASSNGRFPVLKEPYVVVRSDKEMRRALIRIKDLSQREMVVKPDDESRDDPKQKKPLEPIPNDGVFTVFIGGGHANNPMRDIEDAKNLGYFCAKNGYRIITGGGSVEGSMGATHTGFVQYYLDELQKSDKHQDIKAEIREYFDETKKRYDAEQLILDRPELVDKMADMGIINRKLFYAYSMKPLLEMESPSGKEAPGVTYCDAGNRVRRLSALLSSGTKIFMRGGVGTDEEFEETIRQHVEARTAVAGNGKEKRIFADGTPDDGGAIIIFNKDGHLDKLLLHYHLLGDDVITQKRRERYNIKIVTGQEELREAVRETEGKWRRLVQNGAASGQAMQIT